MSEKPRQNTILVTGGAGYIGSHVVKALLGSGYKTIILDNLSTGSKELILSEVFIEGDIRDETLITNILQKYKIRSVIHLAAKTSVPESIQNPMDYYDVNTFGTFILLKCCLQAKVDQFIFSSSAAVYGAPPYAVVSETSPLSPINPYGKSKGMCEQILQDIVNTSSMRAVSLRYFNVAGCDLEGKLGQISKNASHLIKKASEAACGLSQNVPLYGTDYDTPDGTPVRDFIHVVDLADIHIKALNYLEQKGKSITLNCGYGQGFSVQEVLKTMQEIAKIPITIIPKPRREGDCPMLIADCSKMQDLFKWTPKYNNLKTILQSALDWEKSRQR